MVRRKSKEGMDWLEFEILAGLKHGSMLRKGGVSTGNCRSLNFSFEGDAKEHVCENLERVQRNLEIPPIHYASHQVHGVAIAEVFRDSPLALPPCDALITKESGIPLLIRHADCQAAIFYDPTKHALAVAHSGWRGSVQNIYGKVVEALQMRYASRPQDILVGISPSLGPQAAEFINYRSELPQAFWKHQVAPNYFDFWAISQAQLVECGVLPENIEFANMCTYSNPDECFSARWNRQTGRHGTVACMD